MMDGEISLVSEAGCGSRFAFTAVLGVGQPSPSPDVTGLPGRNALLIEPHPRSAEIIARMLVGWGIVVSTVRCASEGIRLLTAPAQPTFDFIIADTLHPGSDWQRLAAFISARGLDDARMILLTSANQTDHSSIAFPGSAALLTKPVREAKLIETLLHPPNPAAESAEPGHSATDATPHGRRLNVLIVEDNATNRRITRTYLEAWGHTVVAAHDGTEAIRCFSDGKFDLVLMDLQMPRMDGIAATASIRQMETSGARVPILALTANVLKGVREECHAAGMCGYLAKPVREHELLAAIESVVPGLCAASKIAEQPLPQILPDAVDVSLPFQAEGLFTSVNGSRQTLDGLIVDCRDGDFPELFGQLAEALQATDLPSIQRSAHAIKGVIGVFHAPAAYAAASQLEQSARAGQIPLLEPHAEDLLQKVSELLTALERFAATSPLFRCAA
jgi:CheY-like chemotaxis protein